MRKKKICNECEQNLTYLEETDGLHNKSKYHQKLVKEYCKDNDFYYKNRITTPIWCSKCTYLIRYSVQLLPGKKNRQLL